MSDNPYAPPTERSVSFEDSDGGELARRSSRLWAVIIDMLVVVLAVIPFGIAISLSGLTTYSEDFSAFEDFIFEVVGLAFYLSINYRLLVGRGQTIGKRMFGIRAVDFESGRLMPARRVVFIRNLGTCRFRWSGSSCRHMSWTSSLALFFLPTRH